MPRKQLLQVRLLLKICRGDRHRALHRLVLRLLFRRLAHNAAAVAPTAAAAAVGSDVAAVAVAGVSTDFGSHILDLAVVEGSAVDVEEEWHRRNWGWCWE